ncbi:LLM class flavin-dependent oxidoreductase [Paenibacillus rhizovicinus]|uniref:LLM class flavin-dependent oxidoreductase n=1 Tax=Paenibacillus rhizovicinus TaxID=2704463 RepID=A0A6C0P4L2_9BACL|nr:LLM class flavin-dependent oxidoreductase [Paenibacillus rhizovicinus]QHW33385.1 LLM class flavin-dependent oxidoreductase [Paenibacillus rhizovicinus]
MGIILSILDQTPIFPGETAVEAFQHTVTLAQRAEALGYRRLWVSEHHDSSFIGGSSPEVLISHLLAKTERITIGSGGIMLQHYSPYKVAENFNVLASLAPGRVDLGIGRAPGGLPRSTQALQRGIENPPTLTEKIVELEKFIHDKLEDDHPLAGLKASPSPETAPELYVLGTSVGSAEIAASLGLPYVFSQFINGDEEVALAAFAAYRTQFNAESGRQPQAIFALSAVVADSDEEAAALAGNHKQVKIHLESGRTLTVGTVEQAEEYGKQSNEKYRIEVKEPEVTKGSKETVRAKLLDLQRKYGVEEFIITTNVPNFEKRLRSFELLQEAVAEAALSEVSSA